MLCVCVSGGDDGSDRNTEIHRKQHNIQQGSHRPQTPPPVLRSLLGALPAAQVTNYSAVGGGEFGVFCDSLRRRVGRGAYETQNLTKFYTVSRSINAESLKPLLQQFSGLLGRALGGGLRSIKD